MHTTTFNVFVLSSLFFMQINLQFIPQKHRHRLTMDKVAAGARLVISAVVKQSSNDATVAAQRAAHHGLDLSSKLPLMSTQTIIQNAIAGQGLNRPSPSPTINDDDNSLNDQRQSSSTSNSGISSSTDQAANISQIHSMPNPYLVHAKQHEAVRSSSISNIDIDLLGGDEGRSRSKSGDEEQIYNNNNNKGKELPYTSESPTKSSTTVTEKEISRLKEGRAVPSSRVGRAFGFATLGVGLALGTATEVASRLVGVGGGSVGDSSSEKNSNVVSNDANADRLASTLCRMRGAALKMGQMLSIQDESLLPPALTRALKQVRQGAEAMPKHQLESVLVDQLGPNWRENFASFDDLPFAAASIGQVHHATIQDDDNDGQIRHVVVKVQYPGVAQSIESDLRNLTMLITMTGMAPKGLFLDNVIRVGREELKEECNYLNEMANQRMFQTLVENDEVLQQNHFVVPRVFDKLTTQQVITSEFASGGTIDNVSSLSQEERNRIGRTILYLTMKELFEWRIMQTDPNWGNFLYDVGTKQTTLIDFGATKEYPKNFVDGYLRIVWANANRDEATLMDMSNKMGFLTGEENQQMLNAHKLSGFTVGEPFWTDEPFDFRGSQISSRMSEHTSVFLRHRLTPPPDEVYTLHRKLAGAYMLCIKLGAVVRSRDLLEDVIRKHKFDDGLPHPMDS